MNKFPQNYMPVDIFIDQSYKLFQWILTSQPYKKTASLLNKTILKLTTALDWQSADTLLFTLNVMMKSRNVIL